MMRRLMLILVVVAWAMPAVAAETFVVPFTVVPGSVEVFDLETSQYVSATLPYSAVIQPDRPDCAAATGTFTAEIVDDGIEIGLDGAAVSSSPLPARCLLTGSGRMVIEIQVPELGGTATHIRLVATEIASDFTSLDFATGQLHIEAATSSSAPLAPAHPWEAGSGMEWRTTGVSVVEREELEALIPGDTVTLDVTFAFRFDGRVAPEQATVGMARVRFEFKTTYAPEPSAALSLPIGVLGLFGLASLRG